MKLGIAGIVSEWSTIDAAGAERVRAHGFRGVSIFFSKPLEADLAKVRQLKTLLADAGLVEVRREGQNGYFMARAEIVDAYVETLRRKLPFAGPKTSAKAHPTER